MQQRVIGFIVALSLTLALVIPIVVVAQQQFTITGFTLGGSANSSSGRIYTLAGSLTPLNGQALQGGEYTVQGGIITAPINRYTYLPVILQAPQ